MPYGTVNVRGQEVQLHRRTRRVVRRMARQFVLLVLLLGSAYLSHSFDLDCWLAADHCACPCADGQNDECRADQAHFPSPQLTTNVPPEFVSLSLPAIPPPTSRFRRGDATFEQGASPPRAPFYRLAKGLRAPPLPL